MKNCCYFLIILLFASCSKEEITPSIVGRWTLVEVASPSAEPGLRVQNFAPHTRLTLQFRADGKLNVERYDSLQFQSNLATFNWYQKKSDTELLLTNTQTGESTVVYFELNNNLVIAPQQARCPYDEKFVRY